MSRLPEPPTTASRAAPRGERLALGLALLLLLALRVVGHDHGRPPLLLHADERHYAGVAARMSWDDLDPHRFENPPLLTYALFATREAVALVAGEDSARRWVHQGGLVHVARGIGALAGVLTALLLAASARRLWGRRAGWIALGVAGTSFLAGRDAHFGVNDVPMTAWVALTTHAAVMLLGTGRRRWAVLGALAAGAAAATKYNGAVAAALPPLAWWSWRLRCPAAAGEDRARRFRPALDLGFPAGLAALSLLAFVLGNPFALLSFEDFRAGFLNQLHGWGDAPMWGQSREPLVVLYGRATLALMGELPLVLAGAGLVALLRRDRGVALLVLAVPVLYLAGMSTKALFFWRFVLPLLPGLTLLAAAGGEALAARVDGRRGPSTARWVCALALVCLPGTARLVRLDQLLLREPTWLQARTWVLRHLPRDTRLFLEGYPPAFAPDSRTYEPGVHIDKLHEITETGPRGDTVLAVQAGGVLITDDFYRRGWARQEQAEEREAFYQRLEATYEPIAEFAPGPPGHPEPYVLDGLYAPLVDLWGVERPGHTVRVWRIEPRTWLRAMVPRDDG